MGGGDLEALGENLVQPEDLDNPSAEFTKGEPQPPQCRDAWAAILFYSQFIAIAVVGGVLGVPAVQRQMDNVDTNNNAYQSSGELDYSGLIYVTLIGAGSSFVLSAISLFVMAMCPKVLIQISLLFSLVVSIFACVVSFMYGSILGGVFGAIFFLISVCYACAVWRRIPFAAANLNTGLTAVKKNSGVVLFAYTITIVSFFYSMLWMTALVGVYDKEGVIDEAGNFTENNLTWAYFFLLLLALFW
jgi:hypothetical protein